jgi:hypothetical protein
MKHKIWFRFHFNLEVLQIFTPLFYLYAGFAAPVWNLHVKQDVLYIGLLPKLEYEEGESFQFRWSKEWIFKECTMRKYYGT